MLDGKSDPVVVKDFSEGVTDEQKLVLRTMKKIRGNPVKKVSRS